VHEFPSTKTDGKFFNRYRLMILTLLLFSVLVVLTLLLSSVSHMGKSVGV